MMIDIKSISKKYFNGGFNFMRRKRITAWLLSIAMLISLMPSAVFAAESEIVQIEKSDGTFADKYTSFNEAVNVAESGDTLWLIGDDSSSQQVTIDKSLTVELQGHSLSRTSVKVTGEDTVVQLNDRVGGAKINENHYKGFKWEGSIPTLTRCSATIFVTGGSTLKVNGVTGTDANSGTIIYDCATADLEKAIFVDQSTLEINGGTFVAQEGAGRDSLFVYNGNVTINDGYFYRAISFYTAPSDTYPFVVKKCEINGGTSYGAMWIERSGTINGKSFGSGFQNAEDIGDVFLSHSAGSYVLKDSTMEHVMIGCGIYVPDNIESKVLPDGTLFFVGSKSEDAPEKILPETGGKITLSPTVAGGNGGNVTYEWKKDGNILSEETGPTLDIENYTEGDGGLYEVTASQGDEAVTVYFRVGSEADMSASETENWLTVPGNELYVGGVAVTAENAADITGDGITSGTAYFKVEDSVPTLYLDGVTIKGGYKEEDFLGGSIGWMYRIYGIYCKSASKDKLKIKISGENVIKSEKYTDDKHQTAWIYGIIADDNFTELMLEGSDDSSLKVTSEENALAIYSKDWKSCTVSVSGGKYEFKTDKGDDNCGEAIFCRGSLKIENAEINISTKRNRGIWINIVDDNYATGNEVTSIKNSNITVNSGIGTESWDGIFSAPDIVIENTVANVVCDGRGITACDGESITISGSETEISVKSVGPVKKNWESNSASILTEKPRDSYEGGGEPAEITLNDGLAVTTPDAGSIKAYDFSGNDWFYDYRTAVDQYGVFARDIVIKAPIVHCVCGTSDCTSHTGSIVHVADNSLNLVPDIADGYTLTSGSYYLSDDLKLTDEKKLNVSGNVNICLNGHNLEANIIPGSGAVLNICDCAGGGTITNSSGHVIAFRNNGATVNIYSGTLKTVYEANTIIDFEGYTGNTLNLYGGTVEYEYNDICTAIGSRTLTLNLYGGKVTSKSANGIVVLSGKINLCGNTEITAPNGYDSIKVYGKELIDAKGYTGGNIRILCEGFSDGDVVVKNVTDETAGKFTLSGKNSGYILKRDGSNLKYTAVYNVSFDSAGGSGTMASIGGVSGEYELPECAFTAPDRKIFKAWSIDGTEYAPGDVIRISKNITVTAIWADIEKTTVTVDESVQTFGYDSRAKSFTVSANVTGGFDVKYRKDGSDIASPTDAGAYDVIITRAEDDTYKAYSKTVTGGLVITPKDITGASVGDFEKMTYNGKEQIPVASVTADGLIATGEWSKVTNVADKTTFTANGNFTGTITDRPTGMEKAPSGFSLSPTAKPNLKYDKTKQVLIIAGKADGGVLKYSTDNKATWSEELPKGINAGKYEVYFKIFGDDNHFDTDFNLLNASIAKAGIGIPTIGTKVYTGALQKAEIGDTDDYAVRENNGGTKAGRYDVKLELADSVNYHWNGKPDDVSGITLDFRITKSVNNWTLDPIIMGWTYGENANIPSYGVKFGDVKIEYKKADDADSAYTAAVPTNSGDYKVRLSVAATDDFDGLTKVIDFSIAKAQQPSPETPAAVGETIKGKSDGKITGVDSTMEYKADGAVEYTDVAGNEIINLTAGKYLVRYKEKENHLAGSDKTVEISVGEMITVSFDSNGGTDVDGKTCEYNGTVTVPETEPIKDGFEFVGWFADGELTTEWNFEADKLTGNKTLYAKWVHGVVSDDDSNVENVTADGINEVAKSEKTDIELVVKTVDAANEDSEQTAIRSIENAPNNFGFYDITLKKLSGGNITLASSVIEIKMPYDFSGKRNIKVYRYHDGNVREFTSLSERDTVKPFDNGTFFADTQNGCIYIYSSEFSTYSVAYDRISSGSSGGSSVRYTVKFETNGAETVNTQNVIKNSVAKEPAEPKKDGYIFDGWYLSNDFAEKYDFKSKVTKNLTLYAKWTEDKTSAEDKDDNNTSGDNDGKDTPTENDKHDCQSMNFNDLDINMWYHLDTDYVLSNGLMNGTDTKIFAPNKNLTRAMLVAVLYRNEGEPAVDEPSPFIDVEEKAYFGNAVSWAHKNGIVKGISETEFAPDINITREQIAAMIYRYAQFKGIDVSDAASADITAYGDFASISDYAAESVRWAVGSGLINGRDESSLSPKENATRAEFAAILHRFIEGNK